MNDSIITGKHHRVPEDFLGRTLFNAPYVFNLKTLVNDVAGMFPPEVFQRVEIREEIAPTHHPAGASGGIVSGYIEMRFLKSKGDLDTEGCAAISVYFGVRDKQGQPVRSGFDTERWKVNPTNAKASGIVVDDFFEAECFVTALTAELHLSSVSYNDREL